MARVGFIQSELDLKLLVLYIMDRSVAPLTFLQLLDLALCDGGVDYFSLHQVVEHLVQRENLLLEEDRYSITEKGRRNSEICENSLPYSVRCRCDKSLEEMNHIFLREQQVQGQVIPHEDGTATIHLQLNDNSGPLLDLKILAPSCDYAKEMVARYKSRPEITYHEIMELLTRDEAEKQT